MTDPASKKPNFFVRFWRLNGLLKWPILVVVALFAFFVIVGSIGASKTPTAAQTVSSTSADAESHAAASGTPTLDCSAYTASLAQSDCAAGDTTKADADQKVDDDAKAAQAAADAKKKAAAAAATAKQKAAAAAKKAACSKKYKHADTVAACTAGTAVAAVDAQENKENQEDEVAHASLGQQQALGSALSYLSMGGFSQAKLLEQLTSSYGEGFSQADAQWAIDHAGTDWNAQAVDSAQSYIAMGGFSAASLYEQLTSSYGEGFTPAQANYALAKVGY